MRTTCYTSPYGARCSPVIRKFSTAVIGALLHVLLKFIIDVFALIYSHDVSYQIMHQLRSSAHRCCENCGVILWSPCRLCSLSLENRQMLPVADAKDRFSGRLSIMFSCVIAYECWPPLYSNDSSTVGLRYQTLLSFASSPKPCKGWQCSLADFSNNWNHGRTVQSPPKCQWV